MLVRLMFLVSGLTTLQSRVGQISQTRDIQFSELQVSDDTETTAFMNNDLNESSLLDVTESTNDIIEEFETSDVKCIHCFKTNKKRGKPLEKHQNACTKNPINFQ